jgi:hypothetical protein
VATAAAGAASRDTRSRRRSRVAFRGAAEAPEAAANAERLHRRTCVQRRSRYGFINAPGRGGWQPRGCCCHRRRLIWRAAGSHGDLGWVARATRAKASSGLHCVAGRSQGSVVSLPDGAVSLPGTTTCDSGQGECIVWASLNNNSYFDCYYFNIFVYKLVF